jgi:hypothetical protein
LGCVELRFLEKSCDRLTTNWSKAETQFGLFQIYTWAPRNTASFFWASSPGHLVLSPSTMLRSYSTYVGPLSACPSRSQDVLLSHLSLQYSHEVLEGAGAPHYRLENCQC